MTMSCLYSGVIRHRRFSPISHEFKYRVTSLCLDLDTLETDLSIPLIASSKGPSLGWFRRADYIGDRRTPLKQSILTLVNENLGFKPDGKVLLLTHLRYWGFVMNPISVFYCLNNQDQLVAVCLQVTNTPWREKTLYVERIDPESKNHCSLFKKQMHVSPFNPMEMTYLMRLQYPAGRLFFHLENHHNQDRITDATMIFRQSELTKKNLLSLILRQPSVTLKVALGIYWQAIILKLKGAVFYGHPSKSTSCTPPSSHHSPDQAK